MAKKSLNATAACECAPWEPRVCPIHGPNPLAKAIAIAAAKTLPKASSVKAIEILKKVRTTRKRPE